MRPRRSRQPHVHQSCLEKVQPQRRNLPQKQDLLHSLRLQLYRMLSRKQATTELDLSQDAFPNEAPLGEVPKAVFAKLTLVNLNLSKCCLSELPGAIGDLVQLTELNVSENQLTILPEELEKLVLLQSLDISDNELKELPEIAPPALEVLDAYKNKFSKLPERLGGCKLLKSVNFFNNKIIRMPASFAELTELEDLNFSDNKLKTLPAFKDNWKKLKRLAVFWNTMVKLPSLAGLESLERLEMSKNMLSEFPEFAVHPQLKEIDLNGNMIQSLENANFSKETFPTMEALQLNKNNLKVIPPTLFQLPEFNFLNVSECPVESMPNEIGECAKLQVLFWADTQTTTIPESFQNLDALARVTFERSPLDDASKQICQQMSAALESQGGFFKY